MQLHAVAPSRMQPATARRSAAWGPAAPVQAGARQRTIAHYRDWEGLAEQAARRERESLEVKERARRISSYDDFRQTLTMAGDRLVVLEVRSEVVPPRCRCPHPNPARPPSARARQAPTGTRHRASSAQSGGKALPLLTWHWTSL